MSSKSQDRNCAPHLLCAADGGKCEHRATKGCVLGDPVRKILINSSGGGPARYPSTYRKWFRWGLFMSREKLKHGEMYS